MASLQKKGDSWYCQFLYRRERYTFTVGQVDDIEAEAVKAKTEYLLMRIKQHLLDLPPGMDIVTFIQFDGKPPKDAPPRPRETTLKQLRDDYLKTHKNGVLEVSTVEGIEIHFSHLTKILGERFPVQTLSLADLQKYADKRAATKWRGEKISSATIKKELITLRAVWNWGVGMGLVAGDFPALKRVKLAKPDEKPPFQTWEEIERRIATGGLSDKEVGEHWDALYLQLHEITELLGYVRDTAQQPWVFPLFCLAAHTGARRSEMLRTLVSDVDLAASAVVIRERKKRHDQRTTRRVPLTPFLTQVLKEWLRHHPGGQHLFSQAVAVVRSKTKRHAPTPVTPDEAHDHFKRTLAGSKWQVLRGYHVFRHSFISLCASRGTDQRLIDEWVGHQTEEQRKRYRHLLPSTQQQAIRLVFGEQ